MPELPGGEGGEPCPRQAVLIQMPTKTLERAKLFAHHFPQHMKKERMQIELSIALLWALCR